MGEHAPPRSPLRAGVAAGMQRAADGTPTPACSEHPTGRRAARGPAARVASLQGRLAGALSTIWPGSGAFSLIIVTDVGPDPDDAKALLIAATLHKQKLLVLRGVIANGGHQARERARLARCLLDHVNCADVPVGIGSAGKAYAPMPHEYTLQGYDSAGVNDAQLLDGGRLFHDVLKKVPPRSLRVVLISSLRDFADVVAAHADLVLAKVHTVAIQGGLLPVAAGGAGAAASGAAPGAAGEARGGAAWEPDT